MTDPTTETATPAPCSWLRRAFCRAPIHEAALGWDCAVCSRHAPPNLNQRKIVTVQRKRDLSLSGVFLA